MKPPLDHWVVPADPADRPRRQRRAARIIVVDDDARILLFEDTDPGVPRARWWMTPGGGIDPGETEIDAALRELAEETGLVIGAAELIGPVATRVVLHGFSDHITEQHETFFVVNAPSFDVDIAGHTEEERLTVVRYHWWTSDDLCETADTVWPGDLLEILLLAATPRDWPVDLGYLEESTVPVS